MSVTLPYLRFEILRTIRNFRFMLLSLLIPLVLYLAIVGSAGNVHDYDSTGISLPAYFLAGFASFGTMAAMLATGIRIATEREVGWHRQLRITPLSPIAYLGSKVLTSYMVASASLAAMTVAALILGARFTVLHWIEMAGLFAVGLIPFAAAGVFLGQTVRSDNMGPIMGGGVSLLSLIGGAYGPIGSGSKTFRHIQELIPSYWLTDASHVLVGGSSWGERGWITVGIWSLVMVRLSMRAYGRETTTG